jgi:hypothetical protein
MVEDLWRGNVAWRELYISMIVKLEYRKMPYQIKDTNE